MIYTKPPLTVEEQIDTLERRGLFFRDKTSAANYLQNISYYRLRAFTYPFQDNSEDADHTFLKNDISFEDIIDLYVFDRRLRNLIFNELEKIEVAVRTKLSLVYSLCTNNPVWFESYDMYRCNTSSYQQLMEELKTDVKRSNEDFIKHYRQKYEFPAIPPSWMTLEVISFGLLSKLYKALKNNNEKREIARSFGIGDEDVFANWLHAFSNLRNYCAHHSRIWNRRYLVHIVIPYNTANPFITKKDAKQLKQNKLFPLLCAIKYIVDIISPDNAFNSNLHQLISERHELLSLKEMGFPQNWEELPIWKGCKNSGQVCQKVTHVKKKHSLTMAHNTPHPLSLWQYP
ncbi:MAG: Abi family protein [Bacteroidales bacterium]|nr:Abi family protein [Bacteroidales bacterium]